MSRWHQQNQAFVWASVDGQAYKILRFNQSRSGVFCLSAQPSYYYKYSLHKDGRAHGRTSKGGKHPWEECVLPRISDLSVHCLMAQWLSVHPDSIKRTPLRITQPDPTGNSIFIGDLRKLFRPYCSLVIEAFLYDPARAGEVQAQARRHAAHRSHMERRHFKEYFLDDHGKLLGVAIYLAHFVYDEQTETAIAAPFQAQET